MKIVSDNKIFVIPVGEMNKETIVVPSGNKELLVDCLNSYFVQKKKTKCEIFDDDCIMKMDDLNFIYISDDISFQNNLDLKAKTIVNNELSQIIKNNPDMFRSFDNVRENLNAISNDPGMIKICEILGIGLDKKIEINLNDFSIGLLLQMYSLDNEDFTDSEREIIIANLLSFVSKDKPCLMYIDKTVDIKVQKWINSLSDNVYVLIDNEKIYNNINNPDLLILSGNDHLSVCNENTETIEILMYMNHPLIQSNISKQNEKNISKYYEYCDDETTFFIKNSYYESRITL